MLQARSALESSKKLPEIVVFDLDYTLWPFWCETKTKWDEPVLYPDALAIIDAVRSFVHVVSHQLPVTVIRSKNLKVAAASRTPTPQIANVFLDKLGGKVVSVMRLDDMCLDLRQRFDSIALIPASSGWDHSTAQKDTAHFPKIQRETGIEYTKMLFFDDEQQNIQKVNMQQQPHINAPRRFQDWE